MRFAASAPPRELLLYRHDRLGGHRQPLFAGTETVLGTTNPSVIRWSEGSSATFFKADVEGVPA